MADSDQKQKPEIPQWQRKDCSEELKDEPKASDVNVEKPSRASLLDQASRFLEDDDIRDASTDRKVAFLESKGLTNDEINTLLGVSRNAEASSSSSAAASVETQEDSSTPDPPKHGTTSKSSTSKSSTPAPPSKQPSDAPPIITYPEFLAQAQKPPPLVTFSRLLNTFYAAAGTALTIYGAHKYLITPMSETLTSARHDFAETAQSNLDNLNEKLEAMVSEIPPRRSSQRGDMDGEDGATSDAETDTSDPTELFHRDIGTQTSPPSLSRSASSPSSSPSKQDSTVETQSNALSSLHTSLSSLLDSATELTDSNSEVTLRMQELTNYLNDISYSSPYYLGNGSFSGAGNGSTKDDDLVNKIKAEIRGVKGVFLSARNFPAGGGPAARPGGVLRAG